MNLQNVCIRSIKGGCTVLEKVSARPPKLFLPKSLPDANVATNCFRTLDGDVYSLAAEGGSSLPENVAVSLQKILSGNMSSTNFQRSMLDSGFSLNDIIAFFRSKLPSVKGYTKTTNALELAQKGKFNIDESNLWLLYKDDIFKSFLNSGDEKGKALKQMLQSSDYYSKFGATSVESLRRLVSISRRNKGLQDVFAEYKKLFGVDLTTPQKVHRFIGDEELQPLLAGKTLNPRFQPDSNLLDVTLNPELNHNSYRITFNYNSLDPRITPHKPEFYYYHSQGDYSLHDVSAIDSVMPEGYLRIKTVRP